MNEDLDYIGDDDFISGESYSDTNDKTEKDLMRIVTLGLGGGLVVLGIIYTVNQYLLVN